MKKNITEEVRFWFDITLGKDSDINIVGKIIFALPIAVIVAATAIHLLLIHIIWLIMQAVFSKRT